MPDDNVVQAFPRRPRRGISLRQWPITIVLLGVGLSMAIIAFSSFRRGCVVLAATILMAAFLRLFLSPRDAGWLVVRSRTVDVAVLLVMGLGLAILSFWVPAPN
jgi:multisubunit Na+/H+ antiporter MnhB subunit